MYHSSSLKKSENFIDETGNRSLRSASNTIIMIVKLNTTSFYKLNTTSWNDRIVDADPSVDASRIAMRFSKTHEPINCPMQRFTTKDSRYYSGTRFDRAIKITPHLPPLAAIIFFFWLLLLFFFFHLYSYELFCWIITIIFGVYTERKTSTIVCTCIRSRER